MDREAFVCLKVNYRGAVSGGPTHTGRPAVADIRVVAAVHAKYSKFQHLSCPRLSSA